jgi:hypothetical protein
VRAIDSSHAVKRGTGPLRFAFAATWSQGISFTETERGRLTGLLFDPDTG